ncbi:MAG: manganese efflux pump [Thaumarchaeota archaeon]|nr:manganese efflux pump [Nitrososphaerota archaeon]
MIAVVAAIAVSLALDCLSAAFCLGAGGEEPKASQALLTAGFFGAFQSGMILAGWTGGTLFRIASQHDHWIAFILLAAAGAHMIREAFKGDGSKSCRPFTIQLLLALSIATSIDALAVGFSLPFMNYQATWISAASGLASFALTLLGYLLGLRARTLIGGKAGAVGGTILILLGFKILLEHFGLLI